MATVEPLGEKLHYLRRALGWTQLELALAAGISERTVRNAERGRLIRRDHLDYLASALGVSIRELAREPAAVDSLISWRRNYAAAKDALDRIVVENDINCMLELTHPKMEMEIEWDAGFFMGGLRAEFSRKFTGVSGMHRYLELIEEFNSRIIDRKVTFPAPAGDGNLVFLRAFDSITYTTGDRDFAWAIHAMEFDDGRIVRCKEYSGPFPDVAFDSAVSKQGEMPDVL